MNLPGINANAFLPTHTPKKADDTWDEMDRQSFLKDVEFTDPRESFAWGSGLSAGGSALRKAASKGLLGRVGQSMIKAPVPGIGGAVTKAIGAGLTAIPLFAAADVPMSMVRQSEFAKENPIGGAFAELGAGAIAGVSANKLGKLGKPLYQNVVKPAMDNLVGPAASSVLKGIDATSSIASNLVRNTVGNIWDNAITGPVIATSKYLTDPKMSLLEGVNIPNRLQGLVNAGQKSVDVFQRGGRFFREKLEPAIERLNDPTAAVVRRSRTQETLLDTASQKTGSNLASMTLEEKLDFLRGARGSSISGLKSAAQEAIKEEQKFFKDMSLNPKMVADFERKRANLYTKMLQSPSSVLTDPSTQVLVQSIEQGVDPNKWFRQFHIRKAIRNAIANPATTEEQATLLKELFQLPATTPEISLLAARSASKAYLERSLLALRGPNSMVSPTPKPGYVQTKWGGDNFKGLWVDRDLDLELNALSEIEKYSHGVFNRYFTTPWKTMKIILSPAAQIRNTFTNFILNDIGGLPVYRLDVYKDALKGMRKDSPEWKEFTRLTGGGGTFSRNDLNNLEQNWKFENNWYDIPGKILDKSAKLPKQVYNANEQVFKFAKYLHNLEKGIGKTEAALDAIKPTFNYGEITPFVGYMRSHMMPFATWTSKVIPYTFEQAVKHPVRVGKWFMFYQGLQQYAMDQSGMDEDEWKEYRSKFPDYMKDGMYLLMPFRDSQDRLQMVDMTYIVPGIGDIREMSARGIWPTVFQHPAITLPADLIRNRKFSGEPITYDWQPWQVQRGKQFAHIWESIFPSWFGPLGTDYKRYTKMMSEEPGAQTMDQYLAGFFGAKITPLDEQKIFKTHQTMQRIHQAEITTQMKKELRATKDPDKQEEIINRYQDIRRQFLADTLDPRTALDKMLNPDVED